MEHRVCELFDLALMTLHAELGRYDWVPSTALAGSTVAGGAAGDDRHGGLAWLHPQALHLQLRKQIKKSPFCTTTPARF